VVVLLYKPVQGSHKVLTRSMLGQPKGFVDTKWNFLGLQFPAKAHIYEEGFVPGSIYYKVDMHLWRRGGAFIPFRCWLLDYTSPFSGLRSGFRGHRPSLIPLCCPATKLPS